MPIGNIPHSAPIVPISRSRSGKGGQRARSGRDYAQIVGRDGDYVTPAQLEHRAGLVHGPPCMETHRRGVEPLPMKHQGTARPVVRMFGHGRHNAGIR